MEPDVSRRRFSEAEHNEDDRYDQDADLDLNDDLEHNESIVEDVHNIQYQKD